MNKEAAFYIKNNDDHKSVHCKLCPHSCNIPSGGHGICGVRRNQNGVLESLNYGKIAAMGFDPIEKKPLYHYKPGTHILSVGSFGCNFRCGFCQNHQISKDEPQTEFLPIEALINRAESLREQGNIGIAFTYNEPSIWYEYVLEGAQAAKEAGLDVVLVTNGFINEEPLLALAPYVNAMNIDLKAFTDSFYKKICNGGLDSVKRTIEHASQFCHVEVTTLLIGGHNDSTNEITALAQWLSSVDVSMPLHLSRYHPAYQFSDPPTQLDSMERCLLLAEKHLHHVYLGNVWQRESNTVCHQCRQLLIERTNYEVNLLTTVDQCPKCGSRNNIVF